MPDAPNRSFSHLRVERFFEARAYQPPARQFPRFKPKRDRAIHGAALWSEWEPLVEEFRASAAATENLPHIRERGLIIELELAPNTQIDPIAFEKEKYGLQLLNCHREKRPVAQSEDTTEPDQSKTEIIERQVWFVPNGHIAEFEQLLHVYAGREEGSGAKSIVDCIERIGPAAFDQLWTDIVPIPNDEEIVWFEVWLRAPSAELRPVILRQFKTEAARHELRVGDAVLNLRDHTIVMTRGTRRQMESSTALLACIAEVRAGRDFAEFIQDLPVAEQADWGRNLLNRINAPDGSVSICILDTGINRHPLLTPLLAESDTHTIKDAWGKNDDYGRAQQRQSGHGTPIGGIALFGDLAACVAADVEVRPPALLESAKIIPPPTVGNDQEQHAAAFTSQGVALVDSFHSTRRRVYCLASCWQGPNDGRPSAWSAVLDRLAAGEDREDGQRRLFVVAGGNVPQEQWSAYPQSNYESPCQIPAQSWNALVIGAYTEKREPIVSPTAGCEIASGGALAPSSATALSWGDAKWPYRPDVVFEGGNANIPPGMDGPDMPPELLPMSTAAGFRETWFTSFHATSAAAPVAAHFAAHLMRAYPDYWPETVRALIVHSARWTTAMEAAVPTDLKGRNTRKHLLRSVGYGVPTLDIARTSTSHRVTLVAQSELQPFKIEGAEVRPNQMHVYSLPWPENALRALGENFFGGADNIRLRVTLSYFIQPNPGDRGYSSAYRYSSAQLRFRVNQPNQTLDEMIATIHEDVAAEAEGRDTAEEGQPTNPSRRWTLGVNGRTRGSLHSDYWEGPASELVGMQHLVVYPVTGWWRSRPSANAGNSLMRYALVVSLEADDTTVDLYTEIETQINVPIATTITGTEA